jgi:hypothetical protein
MVLSEPAIWYMVYSSCHRTRAKSRVSDWKRIYLTSTFRCMVCDHELVGFQRSFAADHLHENGIYFKGVARSALILRAGARVHRSGRFPLLFRKRKHIGCTSCLATTATSISGLARCLNDMAGGAVEHHERRHGASHCDGRINISAEWQIASLALSRCRWARVDCGLQ